MAWISTDHTNRHSGNVGLLYGRNIRKFQSSGIPGNNAPSSLTPTPGDSLFSLLNYTVLGWDGGWGGEVLGGRGPGLKLTPQPTLESMIMAHMASPQVPVESLKAC